MAKVGTRKRGDKWQYYFEGAPVNGKRKQIVKSGFDSQKKAYAAGIEAMLEYENGGSSVDPKNISVNDYFDEWIRLYVDVNLKKSTKKSYVNLINKQIRPRIGNYKLASITPAIVQGLLNELFKEGKSASYITLTRVVMRAAFEYAIQPMMYLKVNPVVRAKTPKGSPKPKQRVIVSKATIDKLLTRFKGTGFYLPIMIAYHSGLRIGEVYGLTWDNIDFETNTIYVRKQLKQYKKEFYFSDLKNTSSERDVIVTKKLMSALKEEYETQQLERELLGKDYADTWNLVNAKRGGGFYSPNSFSYASRVIKKELGIHDFDFHSLRHTHATMLIEAGANIKDVSLRLGHANIETTLQIYTHKTNEMSLKTVDIFERLTEK